MIILDISTSYIEISIYEKIIFVNLHKFFEKKKYKKKNYHFKVLLPKKNVNHSILN